MATRTDGNSLALNDEAAIRQAIKDVRSDSSSTNWLLVSYDASGRALELAGSGSNGVDEMAASLDDRRAIMYGLFSTTAQFDRSTTTKHGFVKFIGPQMPVMRKAQLAPHAGFVHSLFEPYHLDLAIDSRDKLSAAIAAERIRTLMFTAESKSGQQQGPGATSNTSVALANKFRPAAASTTQQFIDEAYQTAVNQVHQTNGPISWLLGSAASPDRLQLLATGSEDEINAAVAAAASKFESNRANFALFRLIDMIEGHATTKFAYVVCIGRRGQWKQ